LVDPGRAADVDAVAFESEVDGAAGHAQLVGDDRGRHLAEPASEPVAVVEFGGAAEALLAAGVSAFDAVVPQGGIDHLRVDAELLGDRGGRGVLIALTEPVGVVELCGPGDGSGFALAAPADAVSAQGG
jgi:hypothetical protein